MWCVWSSRGFKWVPDFKALMSTLLRLPAQMHVRNRPIHGGHVHRFREVVEETAFVAAADVFFHSVATQGDARGAMIAADLLHQVIAAAVRQTKVRDDEVELLIVRQFARFHQRCGG